MNGVEHGSTPQRIPYVHDGLFTLRLEKDGYESLADEVVTRTETDAVIGIDFFAENFGGRRERVTRRQYDLIPLRRTPPTQEELEAALAHARAFRKRTDAEIAEPGTPSPTRPHPAPSDSPPAGR